MGKLTQLVLFQIVQIIVLPINLRNNNLISQGLASFANRWNKRVLAVLKTNKLERKIIRIYINLQLKIVIIKI